MLEENKPNLLDVVEIDGRLAQVRPGERQIMFLDELAEGKSVVHDINWFDYDFIGLNGRNYVVYLREQNRISDEEFMSIHWGPEQEDNPELKNYVTYFGSFQFKKKK